MAFLDILLGAGRALTDPVGFLVGEAQTAIGAATGDPGLARAGSIAAGQFVQAGQFAAQEVQAGQIAALRGKNRVMTTIQTINPAGQVIKSVTRQGRPFLMQKDFTIAKKVIKLAAQAAARIPKKRVVEGIGAQITRAVKQKVLSTVINGHNGNGRGAITTVDTE